MSKCTFPEELKAGDITSLFKQEDAFSKKNYRPITVLPSVSKIFERLMQSKCCPLFKVSFLHSCCEVGLEYKELVDRKTILLFPQIKYTKGIKLKSFSICSISPICSDYITRGIRSYIPDKADIALKSLGLILAPIPLPNTLPRFDSHL